MLVSVKEFHLQGGRCVGNTYEQYTTNTAKLAMLAAKATTSLSGPGAGDSPPYHQVHVRHRACNVSNTCHTPGSNRSALALASLLKPQGALGGGGSMTTLGITPPCTIFSPMPTEYDGWRPEMA